MFFPFLQADKIDHWVTFGAVEGENRGDLAMDPPRLLADPYFWMRDDERTDPKVLERLGMENAHALAATAHLSEFRDELYAELKGHVKETDDSAPVAKGKWEYFTRTLDGQGYAIHCRRPRTQENAGVKDTNARDEEEIILDENALAARNKESSFTSVGPRLHCVLRLTAYLVWYYVTRPRVKRRSFPLSSGVIHASAHAMLWVFIIKQVGDLAVSPSQNLLAYTVDTSGSETFDLVVKKLQSAPGTGDIADDKEERGEEMDRVSEIDSSVEWGKDDATLYYLKMDDAHRPYQAWRHTVNHWLSVAAATLAALA